VKRFRSAVVAVFVVAVVAALLWVLVLSFSDGGSDTAGLDSRVSVRLEAPLRDLPASLG
jgi:hypothetical protein